MPSLILVIDVDREARELAMRALSSAGHVILSASDAESGFQLAVDQSPDLILCDVSSPAIDGIRLAQRLAARGLWDKVPIIALASKLPTPEVEALFRAHFEGCVQKPLQGESFVRDVEAFLGSDPPAQLT